MFKRLYPIFLIFFLIASVITGLSLIKYMEKRIADKIYLKVENFINPIINITEELTKDPFVLDWFKNPEDRGVMDSYLGEKTGNSSIFAIDYVVSRNLICYQSQGTKITLEENLPRDEWYFNHINSGNKTGVEVFYDSEVGVLYIYYNSSVFDTDGSVLGILGALITFSDIIEVLTLEGEGKVTGHLTDIHGNIYLHPDQTKIGDVDIYDYHGLLQKSSENNNINKINSNYIYRIDKLNSFLVVEF